MKVARYFVVDAHEIEPFDEYKTQERAFSAAFESGLNGREQVVLKLLKDKVKREAPVDENQGVLNV